jgi:hypothetical protein
VVLPVICFYDIVDAQSGVDVGELLLQAKVNPQIEATAKQLPREM